MSENQNKLMELVAREVEKNHGVVFLATLKEEGYPNQASLNYLKKEGFEKISGGIYLSPLYYEDEMYIYQKRFAKGVYSHETALYLHGLSDTTPFIYTMTFPRGYHSKKIKEAGEGIAFQKPEEWESFIGKLNQFIKSNHNYIRGIEDKQIGKYFIKAYDDKISYAVLQSKLMFFIWDSVFNRDKKPLGDLLGVSKDELVTFGDFALKVKTFIKAIQER